MFQILKFLPKLLFDKKLKFIIGLLMLTKKALEDVVAGKSESDALDAAVKEARTLLPPEIQATATDQECLDFVHACITLIFALKVCVIKAELLFSPNQDKGAK